MTKFEKCFLVALIAIGLLNTAILYGKNVRLAEVAESNRLVAEETRELTEAIHENNRLLEIVEGTSQINAEHE
ncbi:MAG: hypothetical protein ACRCXB_25015 [Aeromonadaceae bacterium]